MDILNDSLVFRLTKAQKKLNAFYTRVLEPFGITMPQFLLLAVLFEQNGRTVKEFGELLDLKGGAITPLLDQLEKKELIERRPDQFDRRVIQIVLTDRARSLEGALQEHISTTNKKIKKLIAGKFTPEQFVSSMQILDYIDLSL